MNNTETTSRPPLACKRCGCEAVQWRQTRAGKWYLALRIFESDNARYAAKVSQRPHSCESHQFHSAAVEHHQAEFYA